MENFDYNNILIDAEIARDLSLSNIDTSVLYALSEIANDIQEAIREENFR